MPLSSNALGELRAELKDLQRRRSNIDDRIKGIELVLVAEQADRSGRKRTDREERTASRGSGKRTTSSNGGSLRTSVLEILRSMTSGSNAAEITKRLEEDGFRVGGETSLRLRVGHELSRLRHSGVLRKRRNKKYVVAGLSAPNAGTEPAPSESSAE